MPKTNGKPTNGHRNGKNGSGNGHKAISPQQAKIARLEARNQAIEMFLDGVAVAEIARMLGISARTVHRFVENEYFNILERHKDYFDRQLACWFDQKLAAVQEMSALLADREFLQTADTERIRTLTDTLNVVSDRVFVLMSAVGANRNAQRPAHLAPAPDAGSNSATDG